MLVQERKKVVEVNWTAILSYTGSLAVSLAIWAGLIRIMQHLAR
jgi:hypothetical protein